MVRQVAVALGMLTAAAIAAPPVGDPGRTESRAIGLLRGVQTAEALQFSNHGYYDTLLCLASEPCVKSQGEGPAYQGLVAADVAALKEFHGYRLFFYSGPRSSVAAKSPLATPLQAYAMVLVPKKTDAEPEYPALCGDSTGRIYWTRGATIPHVMDGLCQDISRPLN